MKFTDRSPLGSDDYYNTALRDAFSIGSGLSDASEEYSEWCGRPSIHQALQLAAVYKKTGDQVQERYGIDCKISLEGELNTTQEHSFASILQKLPVKVQLRGVEQKVEQSFKAFIEAIGDPYFIARGSDYELADRILGTYGLKTKRKVYGILAGKLVVPVFM